MGSFRVSVFSPVLVLAIVACAGVSAWYITQAYQSGTQEVEEVESTGLPEPLADILAAAAVYMRDNRMVAARDLLVHAVQSFPDDPSRAEIRRLLGRVNVDLLFTDDAIEGKSIHRAEEPGGLAELAERLGTSTEYLLLANGKSVLAVEGDEELQVYSMQFSVTVSPEEKEVVVERNGEFFASYPLLGMKLPRGVSLPFPSEVRSKFELVGGRRVNPGDPDSGKGVRCIEMSHYGVVLRPPPGEGEDATGFFLEPGDLDELSILLGKNGKVRFGNPVGADS
ncbi:MAG TPA: hypothetical protein VMN36_06000 [Verrucomicrobiales bacterium]|nr:hypothetical protein [Verrucomicrobiales bacterium]